VILDAISSEQMCLLKEVLGIFRESLAKFDVELGINYQEWDRSDAAKSCFPTE
jgi:hypothetical protein